MRSVLVVALTASAVIGAFVILSPVLAERLLFFPTRLPAVAPPLAGGVQGADVWLETTDGVRLHGWWFEAAPGAPVLVHFHGNADDLRSRTHVAEAFVPRGFSVLLAGYRGYGLSDGKPTELGLYHDGEAALRFAGEKAGGSARVILYGHSLGGAVATHVASESDVGALIVESAFTSLADIGHAVYPFIPRVLLRRLRGSFDNRTAIANVAAPTLVIHGTADAVVPERMGRELYQSATGPKEWFPVPYAGHNDIPLAAGADWADRIASFAARALEQSRDRSDPGPIR
ncbi:MAG: alpha/beta hydrolase [Longimicrobiales bacterium]